MRISDWSSDVCSSDLLAAIRDAKALATTPPSIRGLGQSNGFTFELLNTGGLSRERFLEMRNRLMRAATGSPKLAGVRAATLEDTPQLKVDIDRSEEHTSELQSLMRISYAVFCLK